jgi:hypothetical protein
MNSIKTQLVIDRLFDEIVLPLHERLRVDGVEMFPPGPDVSATSYYIRRAETRMGWQDFEAAAYESAEGLAAALRRLWQNGIPAALAASADKQAEVATALEEAAETQTEDVSPFIYVMF